MLHTVVSIYDAKALTYCKPIFVQSPGAAIRAFGDAVKDGSSEFSKHPEDYIMFEFGGFDDQTGIFTNHLVPVELVKALALVETIV